MTNDQIPKNLNKIFWILDLRFGILLFWILDFIGIWDFGFGIFLMPYALMPYVSWKKVVKMKPSLSIEGIKEAILSLGDKLKEAEAIGICGSLARGNFHEKSDIDIFVVIKEKKPGDEIDRIWWDRINEALKEFRRDVTVLVYPIIGLKKIITWYVLRLASEGILIYDQGDVKGLFCKIIAAAKEAGLVEKEIGNNRKVWSAKGIKLGERLVVEVIE